MDKHSIAIERYAVGRYVDGYYVAGEKTEITAKGNMHPVTGNELLQLPEGDREKDVQKIYSITELKNDDLITFNATSIKYVVLRTLNNSLNSPPHYKAIIVRKQYEQG